VKPVNVDYFHRVGFLYIEDSADRQAVLKIIVVNFSEETI